VGRRRLISAALLGFCALVPATSASQNSAGYKRCRPPGSVTLASSRQGRLFQLAPGRKQPLYWCAYSSGREIRLIDPFDGTYAFPPPALRVTGHLAAYAWDDWENIETYVRTVDLRYGYGRSAPNRGTPTLAGSGGGYVKVGNIQLGKSATVVWITCPENPDKGNPTASLQPSCDHPGRRDSVWAVRSDGKPKFRLDRGRTIDPTSLTRHGKRYCWRHGAHERCKRVP
jgi:hypothetical protein